MVAASDFRAGGSHPHIVMDPSGNDFLDGGNSTDYLDGEDDADDV